MGKKSAFRVFNVTMGDSIALVEMDEDLLAPDAGILDHKTMTLRSIKNGGQYTLEPVNHPKVAVLKRVQEAYKNCTEKPAKHLTTHFQRMDELLGIVGLMFGEVELKVVESKEDLDLIINPKPDKDVKTVKVSVLGDLLKEAEEETGIKVEDGHVHGPGCNHGKNEDDA